MRHVSAKYEQQLHELAATLVTPERYGDVALQDTVEFTPVAFPNGLRLVDPPEHGWEYDTPPEAA